MPCVVRSTVIVNIVATCIFALERHHRRRKHDGLCRKHWAPSLKHGWFPLPLATTRCRVFLFCWLKIVLAILVQLGWSCCVPTCSPFYVTESKRSLLQSFSSWSCFRRFFCARSCCLLTALWRCGARLLPWQHFLCGNEFIHCTVLVGSSFSRTWPSRVRLRWSVVQRLVALGVTLVTDLRRTSWCCVAGVRGTDSVSPGSGLSGIRGFRSTARWLRQHQ